MITFNYQTDFLLQNEPFLKAWIEKSVLNEGYILGDINYIFCDDQYLLDINQKFLNHDTFTDIISFDYTVGKQINGDIYISVERVLDNTSLFNTTFDNELKRVIIHGVLHYCGYKDKNEAERKIMRSKEDYYLSLQNKS
jgi:rRNA maturation RNase YbeY